MRKLAQTRHGRQDSQSSLMGTTIQFMILARLQFWAAFHQRGHHFHPTPTLDSSAQQYQDGFQPTRSSMTPTGTKYTMPGTLSSWAAQPERTTSAGPPTR